MKFDLVDRVLEVSPTRIVTVKHVTNAEEYLQDHFPTFPVLPGVMMLEALVQAARRLLVQRNIPGAGRMVLGQVRALKYGAFVPPGCALRCEVELLKDPAGDLAEFRGQGTLLTPDAIGGSAGGGAGGGGAAPAGDVTAVSGRFVLRAVRVARIGDV